MGDNINKKWGEGEKMVIFIILVKNGSSLNYDKMQAFKNIFKSKIQQENILFALFLLDFVS